MIWIDSFQPLCCVVMFQFGRQPTLAERQLLGTWCIGLSYAVYRDGGRTFPAMLIQENSLQWYFEVEQYYSYERFWGVMHEAWPLEELNRSAEFYSKIRSFTPRHFGFVLPESWSEYLELEDKCLQLMPVFAETFARIHFSDLARKQLQEIQNSNKNA